MTLWNNQPLEEHEVRVNMARRPCVDCAHQLREHFDGKACEHFGCKCKKFQDATEVEG